MRIILLSLVSILLMVSVQAQQLSEIDFSQEGNNVRVTYTLDAKADISLYVSQDGGVTFSGALQSVSGDVGKGIQPGKKSILWIPFTEPGYGEGIVGDRIMFKVHVGGESLNIIVNGVSFDMIYVYGGTFDMGATAEQVGDAEPDESPMHKVTLSGYYMGKYEVTQGLWKAVMGKNLSFFKEDNLPVETVSWDDCQEFIQELNRLTGKKFSLPTEAQWEYAARGGSKSSSTKYAGSFALDKVGWYEENSDSKTHPVGSNQPNELGLYDMSGNVWEWCNDRYGDYSAVVQTNPIGPSTGSSRVLRGGSWNYKARYCRVSSRNNGSSGYRFNCRGFRLVLVQ